MKLNNNFLMNRILNEMQEIINNNSSVTTIEEFKKTISKMPGIHMLNDVVDKNAIMRAQQLTGVKFGNQLLDYIRNFSCLSCCGFELFSISNNLPIEKCDMIKTTMTLHESLPFTKKWIAIENDGDGYYAMVDSNDHVYRVLLDDNSVKDTKMNFFDFVIDLFNYGIELENEETEERKNLELNKNKSIQSIQDFENRLKLISNAYYNKTSMYFSANNKTIIDAQKIMNVRFGKQLLSFFKTYNYVECNNIKFLGLTEPAKTSIVVDSTLSKHKLIPSSKYLIQIEFDTNGTTLIDSNDYIYRFSTIDNSIKETSMKLFDYIIYVFENGIK